MAEILQEGVGWYSEIVIFLVSRSNYGSQGCGTFPTVFFTKNCKIKSAQTYRVNRLQLQPTYRHILLTKSSINVGQIHCHQSVKQCHHSSNPLRKHASVPL